MKKINVFFHNHFIESKSPRTLHCYTPFENSHNNEHINIVDSYEKSDLIHLGQIKKHHQNIIIPDLYKDYSKIVVDIFGDCDSLNIKPDVCKCNIIMNSVHTLSHKIFVRPLVTKLLLHLCETELQDVFPQKVSIGFMGQADKGFVRMRLKDIIDSTDIDHDYHLDSIKDRRAKWGRENTWGVDFDINSELCVNYIKMLQKHLLCLSPRGHGHDSARFYEICAFRRVPIIFGTNRIAGEDIYDTSFVFRINNNLSDHEVKQELITIYNTPYDELVRRAEMSYKYFNTVIKDFVADPTLFYIKYLYRNNILNESQD